MVKRRTVNADIAGSIPAPAAKFVLEGDPAVAGLCRLRPKNAFDLLLVKKYNKDRLIN